PLGSVFVVWQPGSYRVRTKRGERARALAKTPPAIEIAGPWEVRFPGGWGAPASKTFPRLVSWTEDAESGVRYFSGVATYRKQLEIPRGFFGDGLRLFLDLGEVHVIARVRLNGREMGICWTRPYRLEITEAAKPGANLLEVEVANTWSNRLTGDAQPNAAGLTRTNVRWSATTPLLPSGLLGPVRILAAREAELTLG
ncbi:MAG: glycosylhydrolase-like jelly roll fold domain-containing protein, partial [Acidobacteriota bacterium]